VACGNLIRRFAGLDVHKASVVARARVIDENGELQSHTQSFGTTTSDLLKLDDWLMSYSVTIVGMESTGVYWKPVYTLLETGFACWLLNAQHLRNVPGGRPTLLTPPGLRNWLLMGSPSSDLCSRWALPIGGFTSSRGWAL
jgi:hypothetical protein